MEIVLGWFVGAVVVGIIAAGKGRSFFGAFLVSLFFSPLIGLVVVLVSKSGAALSEEAARSGDSDEFRGCPKCAETIRREALVCKHCGADLAGFPPPPTRSERMGKAVREFFR
jgi:hypothetical protein